MACAVCQHCLGQLGKNDPITISGGYSYHKKCHKCYVCSETNLHDAEVFKGVIFCSSCSQRIFQGCSTAKKHKNGNRSKERSKPRARKREQKYQEKYSRRSNYYGDRTTSARHHPKSGVLEMTRHAVSTDTESSSNKIPKLSNTWALSAELSQHIGKSIYENNCESLKKNSIEIGMTTEVTQELLRQMNCPVISGTFEPKTESSTRQTSRERGDSTFNKTIVCSDLRIAGLGMSTEIAHMALRKKSELPVLIKSDERMKELGSYSLSGLNQESDLSDESKEEWLDSLYSIMQSHRPHWLDRRIGSLLKMPYLCFKKNILDKSSIVSSDHLLTCDKQDHSILMKKFRALFSEEIVVHHQRGIKRLYSTINRRRSPHKLGWLHLMTKMSTMLAPQLSVRQQIQHPKRCKHFRHSHSYRCMRAHVMRMAGPTKSEQLGSTSESSKQNESTTGSEMLYLPRRYRQETRLACYRSRMKSVLLPTLFLKKLYCIALNKTPAIMTSHGCGSDGARSITVRQIKSCHYGEK